MELRFTVIIPVLNLSGSLDLLMRCLEVQTFARERFECIVVDDGSTDGSREFLETCSAPFNLRVLSNKTNLGRSAARNIGCANAKGEILVFLDGDVLPSPSWLSDYDEAFLRRDVDVLSGGRYSITVDPQNAPAELSVLLGTPLSLLFRSDITAQFQKLAGRARLGQYPTPLYERLESELEEVCREFPASLLCAFSFITSNIAVYKRCFDKTSGFCSFIVRLQDTELGLQLWEAGCRFGFVRSATAYHLFSPVLVDLDINYKDVLSLFYRHPYKLVLKMVCWGLHKGRLSTKPRLSEIATCNVVNLDVGQEFHETFAQPVPANCQYSLDSIVSYAHERSRLPAEEISKYVDQGIAKGLYSDRRKDQILLDRHHTVNWLQNNTLFREGYLRQSCCLNNPTDLQQSEASKTLASLGCRGRYEVLIRRELFSSLADEVTLQVPVPILHPAQTQLHIEPFHPDSVSRCEKDDHAVYSWRSDSMTQDVIVGYDFTCHLHETSVTQQDATVTAEEDLTRFRRSALPPSYMDKATTLLRRIGCNEGDEPFYQARTIYTWILKNYAFRESTLSNLQIFEIGAGPCDHAAKLFIELCRLRGIPAREQCGALLQNTFEAGVTQTVESVERGYSPFMHTWAEFYDTTRGWVSVEFLGWLLGKRTLTDMNARDGSLRSLVERNTEMYDHYFFGNLDPFRVRSQTTSNKLRTYPILKSNMSWDYIYRALFATRHRLTCTITKLGSDV